MTISMNDDLLRALAASTDAHLTIVDPINNESYVVLPTEEYERLSAERLIRDSYPLQEEVAHGGGGMSLRWMSITTTAPIGRGKASHETRRCRLKASLQLT